MATKRTRLINSYMMHHYKYVKFRASWERYVSEINFPLPHSKEHKQAIKYVRKFMLYHSKAMAILETKYPELVKR